MWRPLVHSWMQGTELLADLPSQNEGHHTGFSEQHDKKEIRQSE